MTQLMTDTTITDLLDRPPAATLPAPAHLWGFGGLHGGLALAALTASMTEHAPDRPLRGVVGHYLRSIRDESTIEVGVEHRGSTATTMSGALSDDRGRRALTATATFAVGTAHSAGHQPPFPPVPPPEQCEPFALPPELVPFSAGIDLRPATPARPFAGLDVPELAAWIRLAGDDTPVDVVRLVTLLDALAPSYAAVLTEIALLPTVRFSVSPTAALSEARSPWVLVRATSTSMSPDGWGVEALDAWTPDGAHVGTAEQLRVMMAP